MRISDVPPSWRIAMSNDTRVRVEFFSKIIASVWPASGASLSAVPFGKPLRAALRDLALSRIDLSSLAGIGQRSRKWFMRS